MNDCVWFVLIFQFLAFNVEIFIYQLRSFETIYKLVNILVATFVLQPLLDGKVLFTTIMNGFTFTFVVLMISTHDAWNVDKKIKFFVVLAVVCGFIFG